MNEKTSSREYNDRIVGRIFRERERENFLRMVTVYEADLQNMEIMQ